MLDFSFIFDFCIEHSFIFTFILYFEEKLRFITLFMMVSCRVPVPYLPSECLLPTISEYPSALSTASNTHSGDQYSSSTAVEFHVNKNVTNKVPGIFPFFPLSSSLEKR